MQFVYVVGHGEDQYLCRDLFLAAQQELPKAVVLLYRAKGALRLYRPVHPEEYSHRTGYALKRGLPLRYELLGYLKLPVSL